MNRYATDPPDDDRYSEKPIDVQDEPKDGESWAEINQAVTVPSGGGGGTGASYGTSLNDIIDPAEQAMHTLIDALATLKKEIVVADLGRITVLRLMTKHAEQYATETNTMAAAKCDEILERQR